MRRRKFIDSSVKIVAGGILLPAVSCSRSPDAAEVSGPRTNWAGNYTYHAEQLYRPGSIEELQELVRKLGQQKALGSTHCFNNIADSPGSQIATNLLNRIITIDETNKTVTVEGGIRYGQLAPELEKQGFALHNLASLPHISIVGACATATHGSGVRNGNMPSIVRAIEMVRPDGEMVRLEKGDPDFNGAVVSLGALGIIVRITLDMQETFAVRQDVFLDLPLQSIRDHFHEIMSSGYSVSLFTDWQNEIIRQVWVKRRMDEEILDLGNEFYGGKAATEDMHPTGDPLLARNCTPQLGVAGPWYERLPHFKWGFAPSSGNELQSEFFIPSEYAVDAMMAIEGLRERIKNDLIISEIRTIAADELWLSPCYGKDCITIHFTWKQNWEAVSKHLPIIEAELSPFGVVPHWGKMFTMDPSVLQSRHKRMTDFRQLAGKYDPEGKFRNAYLNRNIYPS